MEASNCCQRPSGWGLGFESRREGAALSFCPSFFLHLFCEWVPQPLLIRLSFMESQALSPGDGNPGTWQRPHDLPAPRCLLSFLFPPLFFSFIFHHFYFALASLYLPLLFPKGKKKISLTNFWVDREYEVYKMQKKREERAGFIYGKEKRVCAGNKAGAERRERAGAH